MTKTNLILAVVIVVAIIGGGIYVVSKKGGEGIALTDTSSKMSLKALLSSGKEQTCTFSDGSGAAASNGTVYFANGKMRGDFVSVPESGVETMSHMIVDGNTSYIWTDGMPQGFKMSFDAVKDGNTDTQKGVDINHEYDYKCTSASPNASLFELPKNITFSDMSVMMQGIQGGATSDGVKTTDAMPTLQCSQCDLIPDPTAKKQCQIALGCKVTEDGVPQSL